MKKEKIPTPKAPKWDPVAWCDEEDRIVLRINSVNRYVTNEFARKIVQELRTAIENSEDGGYARE